MDFICTYAFSSSEPNQLFRSIALALRSLVLLQHLPLCIDAMDNFSVFALLCIVLVQILRTARALPSISAVNLFKAYAGLFMFVSILCVCAYILHRVMDSTNAVALPVQDPAMDDLCASLERLDLNKVAPILKRSRRRHSSRRQVTFVTDNEILDADLVECREYEPESLGHRRASTMATPHTRGAKYLRFTPDGIQLVKELGVCNPPRQPDPTFPMCLPLRHHGFCDLCHRHPEAMTPWHPLAHSGGRLTHDSGDPPDSRTPMVFPAFGVEQPRPFLNTSFFT